jgi:hypothetical protein
MLPTFVALLFILAQYSQRTSSNAEEVLLRILAAFCVLFILWLGTIYLLYRRVAERKRRQREGLEPLPDIHVALYRWFKRLAGAESAPPSGTTPSAPIPDLGMLTGDLPQPAAEPAYDPVYDARWLPESFSLDAAQPEEVNLTNMEETTGEETEEAQETGEAGNQPSPPDSVELLRVWRDLSDGSLTLEIGGRRFKSVSEMRAAHLDRRLLNVVHDLTAMLRAAPQPPQTPPPPPPPPSPRPKDDTLPSMAPGDMFRQMGRVAMGHKSESIEQAPEVSIPDQIEELLQARLVNLPEYAERSIHVRPSPHGGVRIEVDEQYFDGVDKIPDDKVRALIQDTVREWEKRM